MALKEFAVKSARPLPVLILTDVSGSMGVDGKIEELNQSMRDMVKSFAEESRLRAEIQLGVITFGGKARNHLPLTPAHQIEGIQEFVAAGGTPLGGALTLARDMIEDKELIPSRAYRPIVVLVSDGHPTDAWEEPFQQLLASERAQKATRVALAIGNDADEAMLQSFGNDLEAPLFHADNAADEAMLQSFGNDREAPLFHADNAAEIVRFFRAVTMSVASHSRSTDPGATLRLDYKRTGSGGDDEIDLDAL